MAKTTKKTDKTAIEFDFKKIDSYEAACKFRNEDPEAILPDVSKSPEFLKKYTIAAFKLAYTNNVIRNGSKLDWSNGNEWKYGPWHGIKADKKHPAGFGFSGSDYTFTYAGTRIGSRLSSKSADETIHFAEIMHNEWMDFKLEIE